MFAGCSDNNNPPVDQNAGVVDAVNTADLAMDDAVSENARFIAWLDDEFETEMDFSPLSKSRMGDKSAHGELDDVSEQAGERRLAWRRDSVTRMQASFDRDALDAESKRSWDLWAFQLESIELNEPFQRHGFIFGRGGPQTGLPNNLINYQTVDSLQDMQDYISRLIQSNRYMLQYLERAKLAANDGVRAPYFDYDQAISEIGRVTNGAPFTMEGSSDIWTDITAKIASLVTSKLISEQYAEDLEEQSRIALLTSFKPAYDEVLVWLQEDKANVSELAEGAWSLPNGEEYYNVRLRTNTTLPLSADEIHQLGISEVARIQSEMEQI